MCHRLEGKTSGVACDTEQCGIQSLTNATYRHLYMGRLEAQKHKEVASPDNYVLTIKVVDFSYCSGNGHSVLEHEIKFIQVGTYKLLLPF